MQRLTSPLLLNVLFTTAFASGLPRDQFPRVQLIRSNEHSAKLVQVVITFADARDHSGEDPVSLGHSTPREKLNAKNPKGFMKGLLTWVRKDILFPELSSSNGFLLAWREQAY